MNGGALVSADQQFNVSGVTVAVGEDNIYPSDDRVGAAVASAADDATDWIAEHQTNEP